MASLNYVIAVVLCASSFLIPSGLAQTSAQPLRSGQASTTRPFADARYGYSLRLPADWKPYERTFTMESIQRLILSTPNKNTLIVSVYHLPRVVTKSSEFEQIGNGHVDAVVNAYLKAFDITTTLGEQKENKSDAESMRFWQGTSALLASAAPALVLSLHAIKYGSDVMVNVVYVSGQVSEQEVKAVDALMDSLSFATR
jgi:hypothetical protein